MNTISAETLLPKIIPYIAGCNDDIAKLALCDAARTFARESDIILEVKSFPEENAPEYGVIPEFSSDPENFLPHHFISRNKNQQNNLIYVTYSLLPKKGLMPESVLDRHYEAIVAYALFILYNMPGKPWSSPDMAALQMQKYRIALGDAIRDNSTNGAVYDQLFICADPGDNQYSGNITVNFSGGTDTSGGTITPDTVFDGYIGFSNGEKIIGNVKDSNISVKNNIVTIGKGKVDTEKSVSVATAQQTSVNGNVVEVFKGYHNENEIVTVGTTKSAATIIPKNEDQTIAAGTYLTGAQTIKGEPNWTEKNIAEGVSMWGKIGTHKGGYDTSSVTATADTMLAGVIAVNRDGKTITGNIATVTPKVSGSNFSVKKGYVSRDFSETIPESGASVILANKVTVPAGFLSTDRVETIPEATVTETASNVTITPGYVASEIKIDINAGLDIDFSGVNVTSDKLLIGSVAINATGAKINGTIPVMPEPTISAGTVTIPKGYNAKEYSVTVAEANSPTVKGNAVTFYPGYNYSTDTIFVGTPIGGNVITPGTTDQTIKADSYVQYDIIIAGEPNYKEENIAEGVSMWGKVGTFKGGSGGADIDFEGVTVTASDLLSGVVAIDANGNKVTGNIQRVTPQVSKNTFSVGKGYVSTPFTQTIPRSTVTETDTTATVSPGYVGETLTFELNQGGSPFELAKVTEYSPYLRGTNYMSTLVFMGFETYEDGYYSDLNGVYNRIDDYITNDIINHSGLSKAEFKHETNDYYIWFDEYLDFENPENTELYVYIGRRQRGDTILESYMLMPSWTLPTTNFTFMDYDSGGEVTVAVETFYKWHEEEPLVLKGVKATGYSDGEWSFSTSETDFTGFENEPRRNFIYAVTNGKLIGDKVDCPYPLWIMPLDGTVSSEYFGSPIVPPTVTGTLSYDDYGAVFNGSQYIDLPISVGFFQGNSTICFRVYQTKDGRYGYVAGTSDHFLGVDSNGGTYNIWAGNNGWNIIEADSDRGRSDIQVMLNQDVSIAYVHDADKGKYLLYVNGELAKEITDSRVIGSVVNLRFGAWGNTTNRYVGKMRDVRIYDKALSAEQIAKIANGE